MSYSMMRFGAGTGRKALVVALAGALVLSGCVSGGPPTAIGSRAATQRPASEPSGQRVVIGVPSTKGKATLVLEDPSVVMWGTQGDWEGPWSFFVVGDTITVADHVPEEEVLRVYRNGKKVDYFKIPAPAGYVVDFLIRDDRYWLLNWESVGEYRLTSKPHELAPVSHHEFTQEEAGNDDGSVFADGSNIVAQVSSEVPVLVAGAGPLTPYENVRVRGKSLLIDDGPIRLQLNFRHKAAGCERITRTSDATYYWVEEWDRYPEGGYVYKVGNDSQVQEVFTLQRTGERMDRQMIRVADDGKVYQMVVVGKTMKVYRIEPNP